MDKYEDNGDYKCLCDVCKKDITGKERTFETECKHDLCDKHYRIVVDLAFRIVDGLGYCYNEEQRSGGKHG